MEKNTGRELNETELAGIAGGRGTALGLADWAMRAVGWDFVWGGSEPGGVDSAGLIFSYAGGARHPEDMFRIAPEKGTISSIPDTPGIGVYKYGHVGVYVGGGMCVCALNEEEGVVYRGLAAGGWTHWFRIAGVEY